MQSHSQSFFNRKKDLRGCLDVIDSTFAATKPIHLHSNFQNEKLNEIVFTHHRAGHNAYRHDGQPGPILDESRHGG